MRSAPLTLTVPRNRERCVGAPQHEMSSTRGALRIYTAREISVCIEMRLYGVQPITYPANHTKMFGLVNVSNEVV